jgi:carbohydrate kinase (thermoresistant glucokinase family)
MTGDGPRAPIVVMGVAAAGKSTVGRALAAQLGAVFVDADDLHSDANRSKMSAGVPLDDDDRAPWLDAVGAVLAGSGWLDDDDGPHAASVVVACSALRRRYRDRLRALAPATLFVHLDARPEVLRSRAEARTGHFMPPELLDSQLATLEPLAADERGCRVDVGAAADVVVADAIAALAGLAALAAPERGALPVRA